MKETKGPVSEEGGEKESELRNSISTVIHTYPDTSVSRTWSDSVTEGSDNRTVSFIINQ